MMTRQLRSELKRSLLWTSCRDLGWFGYSRDVLVVLDSDAK